MAYLRWSGSDWYVFAHVEGGLAVWCCRMPDGIDALPRYSIEEVRALLSGEARLDGIPGWRQCSSVSRSELLWAMREYIGDETGENINSISDEPDDKSLRLNLREYSEKDRDYTPWRTWLHWEVGDILPGDHAYEVVEIDRQKRTVTFAPSVRTREDT